MIKISLWIISIPLVIMILGCTGQPTDISTVVGVTLTATVGATSTSSPPPSSTFTLTVTKTVTKPPPSPATATATATSSPTSTSTPTTTSTPLPTLPAAERREIVDELIQTNGGCQLPCWWGFIPGQTTWAEAEKFLSQLTEQIFPDQFKQVYTVRFQELSQTGGDNIPRQLYTVADDKVFIITTTAPNTTTHSIAQILNAYKTPDEIWVYSLPDLNDGSQAFFLALLYQKKGFLVTYPYYHPVTHEPILGCYTTIPFPPRLIMWPSGESLTFQEAALEDWYDKDAIFDWQPLAEATNMDIPIFVETFRDPNNTTCLETEAEFWYEVLGYK